MSTDFFLLKRKKANKCVIKPHNTLDNKKILKSNTTGLYKKEEKKPNQNELHSGHVIGFLIYGILETIFLRGENISEKFHITEKLKDINTKYKILKNSFIQ